MSDELEFNEEDMWDLPSTDADLKPSPRPGSKGQNKENLPSQINVSGSSASKAVSKRQRTPRLAGDAITVSSSESESDSAAEDSEGRDFQSSNSVALKPSSVAKSMAIGNNMRRSTQGGFGSSEDYDYSAKKLALSSFRRSMRYKSECMSRRGTSMPISIPAMDKAGNQNAAKNHEPESTDPFVPPHLLEQPDQASRAASISNGSLMKRERLLQRNKILRRTGFLEAGGLQEGSENGGLSELMDPLNRRLMPITESKERDSYKEQSALSALLGTPKQKS